MDDVSTRDHPDWWKPVGGANAQDSILERRSLVWNDSNIADGTVPPNAIVGASYHGKFFTRGCRGKYEHVSIYCMRTAAGTLTLSISPHPCIGPIYNFNIVPGAAWAWVQSVINLMWNYDSMFVWVSACSADVSYGYDGVAPIDGHFSADAGVTWAGTGARLFIRFYVSGETPGDVPVSGIVNNIPIPNVSSEMHMGPFWIDPAAWTNLITIEGAGFVDHVVFRVNAGGSSHLTHLRVTCDGEVAYNFDFDDLNTLGMNDDTPSIGLPVYGADALCVMTIHKPFRFRRQILFDANNAIAGQTMYLWVFPNLMR